MTRRRAARPATRSVPTEWGRSVAFTVPGQPDDPTPPMFALVDEPAPGDLFGEWEHRHADKIDTG